MIFNHYSLFAKPSFCEGIARIVDFGGILNEYNISRTPEETDYLALSSDWGCVGQDIYNALLNFSKDFDKLHRHGRKD
ncbi:MAG: hypothetical protein ABIK20_05180 [Candidatus Omnitrophota bacterium]